MKVVVEKNGLVTTVTINRPEVRNAIDLETSAQLLKSFQKFEEDQIR